MAIQSHIKLYLIPVFFLLFTSPAIAIYADQSVGHAGSTGGQYCQPKPNVPFDRCPINNWASFVIDKINQEKQREQEVMAMKKEFDVFNRHPSVKSGRQRKAILPDELDPVVERVEGKYREHNQCFQKDMKNRLLEAVSTKCDPTDAFTPCRTANFKALEVKEKIFKEINSGYYGLRNDSESEGALEWAIKMQEKLRASIVQMRQDNRQCLEPLLGQVDGTCKEAYESIFSNPSLMDQYARYCEPHNVRQNVSEFSEEMEGWAEKYREYSQNYITAKDIQAQLPMNLKSSHNTLKELEKFLEAPNRIKRDFQRVSRTDR